MFKKPRTIIPLMAPLAVLAFSACGSRSDNPSSSLGSEVAPGTPVASVAGTPTPEVPITVGAPGASTDTDKNPKDPKDSKDPKDPKDSPKDSKEFNAAYNHLTALKCDVVLTGKNLGGMTLTPKTYCFTSLAQLTGTLILDAQGKSDATFVFQIANTLSTSKDAAVELTNGAADCNIFWQVGESATLEANTKFVGNILAQANVTVNAGASVRGRVLSRTGLTEPQEPSFACNLPPSVTSENKK